MHVVDVGADVAIPSRFGEVDEVMISLVNLFELTSETGEFVVGEMFILHSVAELILFFDCATATSSH